MYSFTLQLFTAAFVATIVWSLPVHRRQADPMPTSSSSGSLSTAPATFKVSQEAVDQLTDLQDESNGLLHLWKKARSITNETWLTAEVRMNLICYAHA